VSVSILVLHGPWMPWVFPTEDASFGGQKALLGLRRCECASESDSESDSGRRRCRRKCWELD
jgi:hypothetical protein